MTNRFRLEAAKDVRRRAWEKRNVSSPSSLARPLYIQSRREIRNRMMATREKMTQHNCNAGKM